jgi:flagellar biosynthetic protein FliQ
MNDQQLYDFARETLYLLLSLSGPLLIVGLIVGVAISLLQALTQIQEATLTFVPKIIVIFGLLLLLLPSMSEQLSLYMSGVADKIINIR